jgi:hypothetical protein
VTVLDRLGIVGDVGRAGKRRNDAAHNQRKQDEDK